MMPDLTARRATGVPQRFQYIDALRGLAALWVVLFHIKAGGHIPTLVASLPRGMEQFVFDFGYLGVPVFFVLSGFVIAHCFRDAVIGAGYAARFALRRSIRLDPPYWASILLLIVHGHVSAYFQSEPFTAPSAAAIAAHAIYLQGILGFPQISTVYWTLCQEFQFYVVFAALLWWSQSAWGMRIGGLQNVLLIAAAVSLLWPAGVLSTEAWYVWCLPFFHGFLLGALAYWSWVKLITKSVFFAYAGGLAAIGGWQGSGFTITCVVAAGALYLIASRKQLGNWLSWSPLQWLGMISYSLYLTHTPVSGAGGFVIRRLCGEGFSAEIVSLVFQLLTSLAFAYMFYRAIEKPCLAWSRGVPLVLQKGPRMLPIQEPISQSEKECIASEKLVISIAAVKT